MRWANENVITPASDAVTAWVTPAVTSIASQWQALLDALHTGLDDGSRLCGPVQCPGKGLGHSGGAVRMPMRVGSLWLRLRRPYCYYFRPFWPFSDGGIFIIFGHFGRHFSCFYCSRPIWPFSDATEKHRGQVAQCHPDRGPHHALPCGSGQTSRGSVT